MTTPADVLSLRGIIRRLVPGRAIVLTFRPIRTRADTRAEADFRAALGSLRDEYHDDLAQARDFLESLRR